MQRSQKNLIAGMAVTTYYKKQKAMKEAGILPEGMSLKEWLEKNPNQNLNQLLNQNQDQDPQSESIISSSEPSEPENIEVEVEQQTPKGTSFADILKRASDGLKDSLNSDEPSPRRGRPSKTNRDDFSVLVVSVVMLLVSFAKAPEALKPNKDEVTNFSNNASDIILRHMPVNGKLSADAINVIGMFTSIATWRVRIGPVLESMKQQQLPATGTRTGIQFQAAPQAKANGRDLTPIEEVSPQDADFLDSAARRMRGAE